METLKVEKKTLPIELERDWSKFSGTLVGISGMVLRIRRVSWGAFVALNLPRYCVQCVFSSEVLPTRLSEGDFVRITGKVAEAKINDPTIWPNNYEISVEKCEIIQKTNQVHPVDISKKEIKANLDTKLDYRPLTLRHPKERAVIKIAEGVCRGFREALTNLGFTEIHSPKIVSAGAEGGANIFKVEYFDRLAYLAQSPQFYKQMGVGIFGRVFEIGPVFRAEKHQTSRHLNEYTSLDYEMGPIESQDDVITTEFVVLQHILELLSSEYSYELNMFGAELPIFPDSVPSITVVEGHEITSRSLGRDFTGEPDLEPIEEKILCEWSKKEYGSEFLIVKAFPSIKRPFYAIDDPKNIDLTLSFDLLFRGVEITTGGQRIHDYDMQVEKMKRFGLNPDDFESFLIMHKYGMPPHGGLGMGLERLVSRLLGYENIRTASMFPRDIKRVNP
jgi:nondiscriminating aspartyl-tRNA synthetase